MFLVEEGFMMKRCLVSLIAIVAMLALVGCGAEKPKDSADKAILGYAELFSVGFSDNLAATGMTTEQSDQISQQVIGALLTNFSQFPLSDENVKTITTQYITKLNLAMDIKTKVKKDDDEHPVVEVSASVIDPQAAAQMTTTNEDLLALGVALGQLRAEGVTDDQLKANANFQQALVECINNYIDAIPLKGTQTFDVKCKVAKGDDGKMYWAPEDVTALQQFLAGNK
jgi:hypothetical protein